MRMVVTVGEGLGNQSSFIHFATLLYPLKKSCQTQQEIYSKNHFKPGNFVTINNFTISFICNGTCYFGVCKHTPSRSIAITIIKCSTTNAAINGRFYARDVKVV